MFDRLARSWHLVKASAAVLRSDKELLLFPVISSVAMLLVIATFLVPVLGLRLFEQGGVGPLGYAIGFLFYLVQYFVIVFFNSALVGAAGLDHFHQPRDLVEVHIIDAIRIRASPAARSTWTSCSTTTWC